MIKVGDKVKHLKSGAVGVVVEVRDAGLDDDLIVEYQTETQHHLSRSSYSIDGRLFLTSDKPMVVPLTKLHKLLYGIED